MLPEATTDVQHPLAPDVAESLVGYFRPMKRMTLGGRVALRDLGQVEVRCSERLRIEERSLRRRTLCRLVFHCQSTVLSCDLSAYLPDASAPLSLAPSNSGLPAFAGVSPACAPHFGSGTVEMV